MLTIEEKLDRESSLKWEDKKSALRKEGETITIDKFIDFFTEKNPQGRKCQSRPKFRLQGRMAETQGKNLP